MKNIMFIKVLLFCALTAVATSQEKPVTDGKSIRPGNVAEEKAIRQISEQWKDDYNHGDAGGVAALYAEDAYYLTQHFVTGIVHGRVAIQAYVQRGVDAKYHIDSIQTLLVDCSGDMAYTITRYNATNGTEKVFGVNVVILKKARSKWLIVAHEAAVPDPATAIQTLDSAPTPKPNTR